MKPRGKRQSECLNENKGAVTSPELSGKGFAIGGCTGSMDKGTSLSGYRRERIKIDDSLSDSTRLDLSVCLLSRLGVFHQVFNISRANASSAFNIFAGVRERVSYYVW